MAIEKIKFGKLSSADDARMEIMGVLDQIERRTVAVGRGASRRRSIGGYAVKFFDHAGADRVFQVGNDAPMALAAAKVYVRSIIEGQPYVRLP